MAFRVSGGDLMRSHSLSSSWIVEIQQDVHNVELQYIN